MIDTIMVFTGKGIAQIIAEQGSQAWKLRTDRASEYPYFVGTQNRKRGQEDWANPEAPHGAGFIVGRISKICPAPDYAGRSIIRLSEYALIDIPGLWDGGRYPVRYTSLAALGIDVSKLVFSAMDMMHPAEVVTPSRLVAEGMTIAQAKAGLAKTFGVGVDAIDITIRG